MNKSGPIIVIEDDEDDRLLIKSAFAELGYPNEIVFFLDGDLALDYLQNDETQPFLILSDINLPKLDGLKLREMIYTNDRLSGKCIPYLFFSTTVDQKAVHDAYTMSVQGFFMKPTTYTVLKDTMRTIVEYWQKCHSPNYVGKE